MKKKTTTPKNEKPKREVTEAEYLMFKKLDGLKNIDVNKESRKIMVNPNKYFEQYLQFLDEKCTVLAKFEIYLKMKSIDVCENGREKAHKDAVYFINKYTTIGYLDILYQFYTYALDVINELLSEGINTMLDIYNEGKISKETMEGAIFCLKETNETMSKDKISLTEAIEQVESEKRRVSEMQDRLGQDPDQPY